MIAGKGPTPGGLGAAHALRDRFWHPLCHRAELPNPGDYVKLHWLDEEVVVFNDGGELVVFDNRCPHRGTRFFLEASGHGAISCPYHGWGYRDGTLHIPCRERYDPAALQSVRLNTLQSEWCADFLFASAAPSLGLEAQLGPAFDALATISFNIAARSDLNVGFFDCDWQVAVENALEPLHVPFVHTETLGQLGFLEDRNTIWDWTSEVRTAIGAKTALKRLRSIQRLFRVEGAYDGYLSLFLFPFSMISTTFGYSYSLQHYFPSAEPHLTHFASRLYDGATRNAEAQAALAGFFASTARLNRQVFDEDHAICRRVAPGFRGAGAGLLAPGEEKIAHFRACLERGTAS